MKWIPYILICTILAGCGSFKQSWTNFRAHYNTYYNAEKSFTSGQQKVVTQSIPIHPEAPVLVHSELPQAGAEDFKNTIEKGAQVLRKFPNSKWTDDTLFLMGKSYFYRKEFYLGLQKFEELYQATSDELLKQQAVIWKVRTLLELKQYSQGITFANEQLKELEKWDTPLEAELNVLQAEMYTMLGNWQKAHDELKPFVEKLGSRSLKMKGFFLFGQLLEKLEHYEQAYTVFDKVTLIYTDYQYSYWAELFKGRIARENGDLDQALSLFTKMSKDDKNFDKLDEINYQIAKTLQDQDAIEEAKILYRQILNSSIQQPGQTVKSKTYYQLGIIYSEQSNDYKAAAAYFDSSSAVSSQKLGLVNSAPNASAYAKYASLKSEEQKIDSLLVLGLMSEQRLDSVLHVLRKNRIDRLTDSGRSGENRLANVSGNDPNSETLQSGSSDYGFLNHRDVQLVSAARNDFNVLWGNRPLVDNWRRSEAVQSLGNPSTSLPARAAGDNSTSAGLANSDLGINPDEIPRTEAAQISSKKEIVDIHYQLGNLFFLTLSNPDSAAFYFNNVIDSKYADPGLIAKTKYALHQVYLATGQTVKAGNLAQEIVNEYAGTIYASQISRQVDGGAAVSAGKDSLQLLLNKFMSIQQAPDSLFFKPLQYRRLALNNASSKLAPHIHYRALQGYLNIAKDSTDSQLYVAYLQSGSLLSAAEKNMGNPFTGMYWDSVHVLVQEHKSTFSTQPYEEEIAELNKVLSANTVDRSVRSCKDVGVSPQVKPSMETFLAGITLPGNLKNQRLSGSVTYQITISRSGEVRDFALQSASILESLEDAYGRAIDSSLQFFPLEFEGNEDQLQCIVAFPVKN